jgi:DNA-binding PadR family transcriptional regulator
VAVPRVEVVVLGLLAEEPLYGYQLLERFRERAMDVWAEVGRASVYQALHRLEREGSVGGKSQGGADGPERRVYRITRSGRDRLRRGLSERFGADAPYESEAGVALGFAHLAGPKAVREAVIARQEALARIEGRLVEARAALKGARGSGNTLARRMVDLQEALLRAERTWLVALRREAGRLG